MAGKGAWHLPFAATLIGTAGTTPAGDTHFYSTELYRRDLSRGSCHIIDNRLQNSFNTSTPYLTTINKLPWPSNHIKHSNLGCVELETALQAFWLMQTHRRWTW